MQQPKGFETPGQEDKVIHLKWAIYGLRQSGCEWYKDLMHTLTSIGFKWCWVEHAVFYSFDEDATILAVDVDDITIAGNSPQAIARFKGDLSSWYGIKDMGNLHWLLGIGIDRDRKIRRSHSHKWCTCKRSLNGSRWKTPSHCWYNKSQAQPNQIPVTLESTRHQRDETHMLGAYMHHTLNTSLTYFNVCSTVISFFLPYVLYEGLYFASISRFDSESRSAYRLVGSTRQVGCPPT